MNALAFLLWLSAPYAPPVDVAVIEIHADGQTEVQFSQIIRIGLTPQSRPVRRLIMLPDGTIHTVHGGELRHKAPASLVRATKRLLKEWRSGAAAIEAEAR